MRVVNQSVDGISSISESSSLYWLRRVRFSEAASSLSLSIMDLDMPHDPLAPICGSFSDNVAMNFSADWNRVNH